MHWESWLEKTEPTGLTDKQRKLAEEIAAGDREDQKDLFVKNPKVRKSWEILLEKTEQSTIPKRVEGGLKNDSDGSDVEGILMGTMEQGDIKARSGIRSKHPYKNRDNLQELA